MKKENTSKRTLANVFKSLVNETLTIDAAGTTCVVLYQPKVPKGIEKFKKRTDDK